MLVAAERIFSKKILWLIRTPTEQIAKTHIAELNTKFQSHGLDLTELRAICHVLPSAFENDSDGAKAAWKSKLLERLREIVGKEEKVEAIRRNGAYDGGGDDGLPTGPFDPDASPVRVKHMASTPFTQTKMDDIRRTCTEGGTFNENRDTLRKKREEPVEVIPNSDRIDHSTIGVVMSDNRDFLSRLNSCLGGGPSASPGDSDEGRQPPSFLAEIAQRNQNEEQKDSFKAKLSAALGDGGGVGGDQSNKSGPPSFLAEIAKRKQQAGGSDGIKAKLSAVLKGGGARASPLQQPSSSAPSFLDELKAKKKGKQAAKAQDENSKDTPKKSKSAPSFLDELKAKKKGKQAQAQDENKDTPKTKATAGRPSPAPLGDRSNKKLSFLEAISARGQVS